MFVARNGDWKLGSFECATDDVRKLRSQPDLLKLSTLPVGARTGRWEGAGPLWAFDVQCFGNTIAEAFSPQRGAGAPDDASFLPAAFRRTFLGMITAKVEATISPDEVDKCAFIRDSAYCKTLAAIESLALVDPKDKAAATAEIAAALKEIRGVPTAVLQHKILPSLLETLRLDPTAVAVLPAVVSIAAVLPEATFSTLVYPTVLKVAAVADRTVRAALLSCSESLAPKLTAKQTDELFPLISTGFGDTSPYLRELTVCSIAAYVPRLSDNSALLRHLAKLQQDPEPGIRTNTTSTRVIY